MCGFPFDGDPGRWRWTPQSNELHTFIKLKSQEKTAHPECRTSPRTRQQLHNARIPGNAFSIAAKTLIKIRLEIRFAFSRDPLILLGIIRSKAPKRSCILSFFYDRLDFTWLKSFTQMLSPTTATASECEFFLPFSMTRVKNQSN